MINPALAVPSRLKARPIDRRGIHVPWFITEKLADDLWDFRIVHPARVAQAILKEACWICGERLGRFVSFNIGPISVFNRISSEPPSHLGCAEYASQACPFLANPASRRRHSTVEVATPGLFLQDNPGLSIVWTALTPGFKMIRTGRDSYDVLLQLYDPTSVSFWHDGRRATNEEIKSILAERLKILADMCDTQSSKDDLFTYVDTAMNTIERINPELRQHMGHFGDLLEEMFAHPSTAGDAA